MLGILLDAGEIAVSKINKVNALRELTWKHRGKAKGDFAEEWWVLREEEGADRGCVSS